MSRFILKLPLPHPPLPVYLPEHVHYHRLLLRSGRPLCDIRRVCYVTCSQVTLRLSTLMIIVVLGSLSKSADTLIELIVLQAVRDHSLRLLLHWGRRLLMLGFLKVVVITCS